MGGPGAAAASPAAAVICVEWPCVNEKRAKQSKMDRRMIALLAFVSFLLVVALLAVAVVVAFLLLLPPRVARAFVVLPKTGG